MSSDLSNLKCKVKGICLGHISYKNKETNKKYIALINKDESLYDPLSDKYYCSIYHWIDDIKEGINMISFKDDEEEEINLKDDEPIKLIFSPHQEDAPAVELVEVTPRIKPQITQSEPEHKFNVPHIIPPPSRLSINEFDEILNSIKLSNINFSNSEDFLLQE